MIRRLMLAACLSLGAATAAATPAVAGPLDGGPSTHCDEVCQAGRQVSAAVAYVQDTVGDAPVVSPAPFDLARRVYAVVRDVIGTTVPGLGGIIPPCPPISGC